MNETVARIVELLFQDVEMNDEVKSIHDEVMDNCQERFEDLLSRGLTEDEAIAAVVESLKGMEEVLAGYPRKTEEAAAQPRTADARIQNAMLRGKGQASFGSHTLQHVNVALKNENVTIEPSPDTEVHVICDFGENEQHQTVISAELVNGELRVSRGDSVADGNVERVKSFGKSIHFDLKDISFEGLGEMIGKLMVDIRASFDGDGRVCVQVPVAKQLESVRVKTTSGNVGIDGLRMENLHVSSQSGDQRVELSDGQMLRSVEMHTTSGDVEAWLSAEQAVLQSMSGDMRYVGAARTLTTSSTSGDVTVELTKGICERCEVRSVSGDVECSGVVRTIKGSTTSGDLTLNTTSEAVSFSSVSGDADMSLQGDGLRSVEGHTTSGDVTVNLPVGVREADASFHSTSGDARLDVANVPGAIPRIVVQTVSGDLRIR